MDGGLVRAVVHADGEDSFRDSVVVGGEVVGILTSRSNGTSGFTYLFRGGLGSVEAYGDAAGAGEGTVSYTPFGRLRTETDWETLAATESLNTSYGSRQGFTGGQDLTSLGVVVLGARIYDPALGRWLAPDPAGMSASPYVYVADDPEGLTDPTGAFSLGAFFFQDVVVVGTDAAMAEAFTRIGGPIGGFAWGYLSTGGNVRDGVIVAVEGAAMSYLGGRTYAQGAAGVIEKGLLEGSVGDLATEATGGSFVGGFLGAFSGAVMEPELSYGSFGQDVESVTIASAVGGAVSVIGGGSFANGALSAAFQQMFNAVAHAGQEQQAKDEAAYGEFGAYARKANGKAPANLANAVASAGAVCARNGGGCNYQNGSRSSGWNRQAWNNIVAATGGRDESGGGNVMCVNSTGCKWVTGAYTYLHGEKVFVPRPRPLTVTGEVTVTGTAAGTLTLYFYQMPYQGWLTRNDYLYGTGGPPQP